MTSRWDELSTGELFKELRKTKDPQLRDYLIRRHEGLVRHVARDYADGSEAYEDVFSVGHVGLINAVDRFDPDRGTKFATFAVPTIRGEIQRYFRDRTWGIHVPRRIQELSMRARQVRDRLAQQRGRAPSYMELANELGVSEEELVEAVEVGRHYELLSLESSSGSSDDDEETLGDRTGAEDPQLELIAARDQITQALKQLPPREHIVVVLRYFEEFSQQEVGRRLGISQMHVSRLERKAIARLREIFAEADR